MTHLLVAWLVLSASIWLTALVVPGIKVKGLGGAIVGAAVLGAMNWALGHLLYVIIGVGTLGIGFVLAFATRWVVNALLLKLSSVLTSRLEVRGLLPALIGAAVISLISGLLDTMLHLH